MGRAVRRCYMYSREDRMVFWEHVESHVTEAVRNGFGIRREIFPGSGHCAHARGQAAEVYWGIVDEIWQGDTHFSVR